MVGKICTVCRRCSVIEKHLSFFTYPSDPQRRLEWLKAVDRMDLRDKVDNYKTRGNHRICEVHFEPRFVRRSRSSEGRNFLTKDAFPTLCLAPSSLVVQMSSNPPSSTMYSQDIIWRKYQARTEKSVSVNMELKQVKTVRRSIRQEEMARRNNVFYFPEFNDDDSSSSSSVYEDISQFCESVMKISKGTQTFVSGSIRRKLDPIPEDRDNFKKSKTIETVNNDKQLFIQMCSKFLPPSLSKVVEWKLFSENCSQNINLTLFAFNLYYSSNSYNLLREMLSLPTRETLKYFLLPKSTRLSEHLIHALKCKVSHMSAKERVCSFSVGSILLKPNLYYDIKHDRMIGFHDVNGEQNIQVAKYAVLLMVQGILENWQQPIAYALISEYDDFPEISAWIDEILTTLIDIGLDVRAFVSDPRSEFLYASESRYVNSEKTYFSINGADIFYTYDTMQLLRIVKNNLKSCDFNFGPNSTISNNEFFAKLNDLCNALNAKTKFANSPYKRAFGNRQYQKDFLNEMLQLFQNLTVVRKTDGADVTENMKFVEGFQITIKSVLQLFEELNFLGVKSLLTSRLNHDRLNKFFNKVKNLSSKEECTPRQFNKAFVRNFVFNMLKKPIGDNNLENSFDSEDFSRQLLEDFHEYQNDISQPLPVHTTDYRCGLPEKNAFVYVCGYCYLKCIERHACNTFQSYVKDCQGARQNGDVYVCSVSLDLNVKNCVMLPPEDFTEFLMLLETRFKEYLKGDVSLSNIGHELMQEFQQYEFGMPCPCFPIDYLKALFIRVRLFYTVRKNNKLLNRKKGVKMLRTFCL